MRQYRLYQCTGASKNYPEYPAQAQFDEVK